MVVYENENVPCQAPAPAPCVRYLLESALTFSHRYRVNSTQAQDGSVTFPSS